MVRLRLALVCALGVLYVTPQAAAGGGWWSSIHVDRAPVAPGQRVELDATIAFSSNAAARAAQRAGRFSVYVLRGFDDSALERAMRKRSPGDWWSLGGAEAIRVGPVTIGGLDANLARASAAFTLPEIPPATYHLMLCDAGCTEPLMDVIPAEGFTVVADPATARMAKRVSRLERRTRKLVGQLAAARADGHAALGAARKARSEVWQLKARVSAPEKARSNPRAAYAGWLVAAPLAAALALLALRGRAAGPLSARLPGRV